MEQNLYNGFIKVTLSSISLIYEELKHIQKVVKSHYFLAYYGYTQFIKSYIWFFIPCKYLESKKEVKVDRSYLHQHNTPNSRHAGSACYSIHEQRVTQEVQKESKTHKQIDADHSKAEQERCPILHDTQTIND